MPCDAGATYCVMQQVRARSSDRALACCQTLKKLL